MTTYWISVLNIRERLRLLLRILLIELLNQRLCPCEQDGCERIYVCLLYAPTGGLKFNQCSVDAVSGQCAELFNEGLELRPIGVIPAAEVISCGKRPCSHPDHRTSVPVGLPTEREPIVERCEALSDVCRIPQKLSAVSTLHQLLVHNKGVQFRSVGALRVNERRVVHPLRIREPNHAAANARREVWWDPSVLTGRA